MEEEVLKFAFNQYQTTLKNTTLSSQQKLYQLSMPLLFFAAVKNRTNYHDIFQEMEVLLHTPSSQIEEPWALWMLGRMALASKIIKDLKNLEKNQKELSIKLFQNNGQSIMIGWSFAYFASLDEKAYYKSQTKLFDFYEIAYNNYELDPPKEITNLIWTLAMNIYAASNARNKYDYRQFLKSLKDLHPHQSLSGVLSYVRSYDYPQWLESFLRYSFIAMRDEENLHKLKEVKQRAQDINLDTILALAYNRLTSNL